MQSVQPYETTVTPLHQIGVMARLTLREARRRRLLWIGAGIGGAFSALFAVGFFFAIREFREVADEGLAGGFTLDLFASNFAVAGLYVINFLVVMVAVLTTVGAISQEIQNNTIHAIAVKPLQRWEIILGKWLGHAVMLVIFTVLLALGVILPVWLISGFLVPNLIPVILILVLEALSVMSLTLLGSTLMPTLANGVTVFMLYGLAFVGGWVEQLGALLGSQTTQDLGIVSSLIMPSEGLWRYAASLLQTDGILGSAGPFSVVSQPSEAFVIYAIVYTFVTLGLAIWAFSLRDF